MSYREKLRRIHAQVVSDADKYIKIGLMMRREAKVIKRTIDSGPEDHCKDYVSEIESMCPELRLSSLEDMN